MVMPNAGQQFGNLVAESLPAFPMEFGIPWPLPVPRALARQLSRGLAVDGIFQPPAPWQPAPAPRPAAPRPALRPAAPPVAARPPQNQGQVRPQNQRPIDGRSLGPEPEPARVIYRRIQERKGM